MSLVEVAAAVILRNNQVLLAQRPLNKHQGGLWEFPGGKIELGESPEQALKRELKEEIDIEININEISFFKEIIFDYPDKKVSLKFYQVTDFHGTPQGLEGQPVKWVSIDRLNDYPVPQANLAIVAQLQAAHAELVHAKR